MAGQKRSAIDFPTVTRSEFAEILENARNTVYVRQPHLAKRDASLIAFEFLFKTRVSEGVGRTFPESASAQKQTLIVDNYEGVKLDDFEISRIKGREVLRCRFRVLKRGRRKRICANCGCLNGLDAKFCKECSDSLEYVMFDARLKKHYVWDSVRFDDPFVYYIVEWLDFLRQRIIRHKETRSKRKIEVNPRVWPITRQRAWQICNALGIMNHTQRHWRASQLADTMDAFTLKEALHRATMPFEYVHRAESRRIEKEIEADEIWK